MNKFRHMCITEESTAALRKDVASMYRAMRMVNPKIARTLFVKTRDLQRRIVADMEHKLYHEGSGSSGGLALLFGDK
jgi:hypothetical protein